MTLALSGQITRGGFVLDVDVRVGNEVLGITGPNGSGKTTILRAIAGLTALSAGTLCFRDIVWDDAAKDAFVLPENRGVAMMFQDHSLLPFLTAQQNVAFALRARGAPSHEGMVEAVNALTAAGLAEYGLLYPHQLSGGQSQRVCLVRALVGKPNVVLLDEPLSAIDAASRASVRAKLRESLRQIEGSKILVSHDAADIDELCDRVISL